MQSTRTCNLPPDYGHGADPSDAAWGELLVTQDLDRRPSHSSLGVAYIFLANWVNEYYDDIALVTNLYDGLKAYVEWLIGEAAKDGLDGLLWDSIYAGEGKTCFVAILF